MPFLKIKVLDTGGYSRSIWTFLPCLMSWTVCHHKLQLFETLFGASGGASCGLRKYRLADVPETRLTINRLSVAP